MSRSKHALRSFVILMPGVVSGWAAWEFGYATMEDFLFRQMGGPVAALALWAVLGVALLAGLVVAMTAGGRFVRCQKPGHLPTAG